MQKFIGLIHVAVLGISLAVTTLAQTLTVSPQQVSFAAPAGAATPVSQTVTIISSTQNVPFQAAVRYLGPATGWLSVSPATGTAPTNLTISANPAGLTAGSYAGQITVTAGNLGATVNVLFAVAPPSGRGSLATDASSLTFLGQSGDAVLPAQTLTITVPGSGPSVAFDATASGNWLSVSPSRAMTPATLTIIAVQSGLEKATYNGTITLIPVGGGNPTIVPVTLNASASTEPETLRLSHTLVTFNHQVGTSVPALERIEVDTTSGSVDFTARTATPWLRFSPGGREVEEITPGQFHLQVDPSGLAPGAYAGSVTIASDALPTQTLPVALNVTTTAALNADPSAITIESASATEQAVTIRATGAANLEFTATAIASGQWLSVIPNRTSTAGGSAQINIRADATNLTAGTYHGAVNLVVAGGSTLRIPVRLIATSTTATLGTLNVSTETIQLTGVPGFINPSHTIQIGLNDVTTTHDFTATASSTGGWLSVDPFSGRAPGSVKITANSAAVPGAGTHNGSVIITSLLTNEQVTVPVAFTVAAQAIAAEPTSVSFTPDRIGAPVPAQTIQIRANTPSTFSVMDLPRWLRVSPTQGSTPAALMIWPDVTVLPPGTSSANIRIVGPNNQLTIAATARVPEPPRPTATPDSITFTHQLGSPAPASQRISIGSTGDAVTFTASAATDSGVRWLSVTPASGSTPAAVTAGVDTALLVPGRHSGTITIAGADGSAHTVPVSLSVNTSTVVPQGLVHGATFAPTAVAPGQIVAITGTGLGPATGISARPSPAGAIESRLADVRVLFDGIPAPLLFVRADQINAVVPYALHGRVSTRVQVEMGASYSLPIEVKVIDAAPGIFTANGSGRGQAAVVNADLTPNSAANPAARGSIISLYGTGEGQTDPPGQDGRIILTDLRRPMLPVTAKIGGIPAEVTYAGSASGLVSGAFQANIRIPEGVEPGILPIEIQIGSAATQSGVTIAVR
jgi:uncharacterized protein (TIGR03437 family)